MSIFRDKVKAARGGTNRRAAPAGGAWKRGRGCHLSTSAITVISLTFTASAGVASADPDVLALPSGQPIEVLEYLDETDSADGIFRARYLAPGLSAEADLETVFTDLEHLCNAAALPEVAARQAKPARIVVSISAEPLELGTIAPDVPQYFESYTVVDGTCIWELY